MDTAAKQTTIVSFSRVILFLKINLVMNVRSSSHSLKASRSSINSTRSSVLSLASTQRKLNRTDFAKCYVDYCNLQHSIPLQTVKQHLEKGVLDFTADRVKFDEWSAIISALRTDQTLHRISIRLRQRIATPVLEADTDIKARSVTDHPAIATKFVLYWLLEALKNCLAVSSTLTVLELEGLPIKPEFLALLAQGIADTKSLQHFSLSKCGIGDEGIEVAAAAIRNAPTIISVAFSNCDLSSVGALTVAKLISLQKLNRYGEVWKLGLRYRDPDIEAMAGLRRVTLNNNPEIGDQGIEFLANEAKDDIWLRAIDLQNTGMTDKGSAHLIHLVRTNPNLSVVDARNNPEVSEDSLREIMAILAINNADKTDAAYKWFSCQTGKHQVEGKNTSRATSILTINNADKTDAAYKWFSRQTGKNQVEGKNTTRTSSILRLSPPKIKRHATICSSSSFQQFRSISSEKGLNVHKNLQNDLLEKENRNLREQLGELNQILNLEIKIKAEILKENQYLKNALEVCQLEKKEIEDDYSKQNYISDDALMAIKKMLHRFEDHEDFSPDPQILESMFSPVVKKKQSTYHEPTIMEEIEESSSDESVQFGKKINATIRAQEIFRKILKEKLK